MPALRRYGVAGFNRGYLPGVRFILQLFFWFAIDIVQLKLFFGDNTNKGEKPISVVSVLFVL